MPDHPAAILLPLIDGVDCLLSPASILTLPAARLTHLDGYRVGSSSGSFPVGRGELHFKTAGLGVNMRADIGDCSGARSVSCLRAAVAPIQFVAPRAVVGIGKTSLHRKALADAERGRAGPLQACRRRRVCR